LESLGISGEYVMKVDVEGHEANVLAGCRAFFEKKPPKAVVFESTGHKYGGEDFFANEAYTTFADIGFRVFQIHKTLFRLRLSELDRSGPQPRATDFAAVRGDLVHRLSGVVAGSLARSADRRVSSRQSGRLNSGEFSQTDA
jgi:hypothetical protein